MSEKKGAPAAATARAQSRGSIIGRRSKDNIDVLSLVPPLNV